MALDKADLVLHEGMILGHPDCDSVAVGDGRIMAVGRFSQLKNLVGPRTHMVRLMGRTVAPGFIDCHIHFMEGASSASGLSVTRCRTIADLLADLRIGAGRTPPGNWLRAFGFDDALARDRRGPSRKELDQSVPKNPLRLRHQTLHASWLNSRAINLLGLEKPDFKPPEGAWIEREGAGRVSGFVVGMEQWLTDRLPRVTAAELEARARVFSRELSAGGVTAFTDATVRNGPEEFATFAKLVTSGAINQRTSVMLGYPHLDALVDVRRTAHASGVGFAGIKFMDVAQMEVARLANRVERALENGADCAFHATEVDELDAALTACEMASRRVSSKAAQTAVCRIEHGGLIPPNYLERIAALNAWIVSNPGFLHYRGAKYAGEPGLIPYLYRIRSLLNAGINVTVGSDAPVTPPRPLVAMATAMSRVSMEGYELALDEKLDIESAYAIVTRAAAQLSRLDSGEIAPGRCADIIVLPANPLALKPPELAALPVDMTIIDGHVAYERGLPVSAQGSSTSSYSA